MYKPQLEIVRMKIMIAADAADYLIFKVTGEMF